MARVSVGAVAVFVSENTSLRRVAISPALAAAFKVVPIRLQTPEGGVISIDRVTDVRKVASTKAGGLGNRYTCWATMNGAQHMIFVYKDEDEWYLEK